MDYMRNDTIEESFNLALHDINFFLQQQGQQCSFFNLPQSTGNRPERQAFDSVTEAEQSYRLINTLNPQQFIAFQKIQRAMDFQQINERCFFLDGPGGSGKTYLYNTLMSFVRGRQQVVLPFATTGIAATLMKGGRTVHSGFKLPVPLDETSVSKVKQDSPEADLFRKSILIIIDEVTMLPKHGYRCTDMILRELMKCDIPFGGKVVVIGGDFRQTLPVVPRVNEVDVIQTCIKSSELWRHFVQLPLLTNMRSEGQNLFNQWLLDVGAGAVVLNELNQPGIIMIPQEMIIHEDIITSVFGTCLASFPIEELVKKLFCALKTQMRLK